MDATADLELSGGKGAWLNFDANDSREGGLNCSVRGFLNLIDGDKK
jgi:hypothetical protein